MSNIPEIIQQGPVLVIGKAESGKSAFCLQSIYDEIFNYLGYRNKDAIVHVSYITDKERADIAKENGEKARNIIHMYPLNSDYIAPAIMYVYNTDTGYTIEEFLDNSVIAIESYIKALKDTSIDMDIYNYIVIDIPFHKYVSSPIDSLVFFEKVSKIYEVFKGDHIYTKQFTITTISERELTYNMRFKELLGAGEKLNIPKRIIYESSILVRLDRVERMIRIGLLKNKYGNIGIDKLDDIGEKTGFNYTLNKLLLNAQVDQ